MTDQSDQHDAAAAVEPPARPLGAVRVIGVLGIVGGILLIVVGVVAWIMVSTQLRAEDIVIPDDAMAFQGQYVQGPLTAYVQADIIQQHALDMADGQTYAELPMDDPTRDTVMNASFLRASLYTSVVAFGVCALAIGVGIVLILFGWALRRLASAPVVVRRSRFAE